MNALSPVRFGRVDVKPLQDGSHQIQWAVPVQTGWSNDWRGDRLLFEDPDNGTVRVEIAPGQPPVRLQNIPTAALPLGVWVSNKKKPDKTTVHSAVVNALLSEGVRQHLTPDLVEKLENLPPVRVEPFKHGFNIVI